GGVAESEAWDDHRQAFAQVDLAFAERGGEQGFEGVALTLAAERLQRQYQRERRRQEDDKESSHLGQALGDGASRRPEVVCRDGYRRGGDEGNDEGEAGHGEKQSRVRCRLAQIASGDQ